MLLSDDADLPAIDGDDHAKNQRQTTMRRWIRSRSSEESSRSADTSSEKQSSGVFGGREALGRLIRTLEMKACVIGGSARRLE
jgi:hypothetical protein